VNLLPHLVNLATQSVDVCAALFFVADVVCFLDRAVVFRAVLVFAGLRA